MILSTNPVITPGGTLSNSPVEDEMKQRLDVRGKIFYLFTGSACLIIVLMVAFIIGNIFINGKDHLSWRFITAAPEEGMTAGGIFPAIYGTLLLGDPHDIGSGSRGSHGGDLPARIQRSYFHSLQDDSPGGE